VLKKDVPKFSNSIKKRIDKSIREKLRKKPHLFGKHLVPPLKGYLSLRVGNYRIIYKIQKQTVIVYIIGHRSKIYKLAEQRILQTLDKHPKTR